MALALDVRALVGVRGVPGAVWSPLVAGGRRQRDPSGHREALPHHPTHVDSLRQMQQKYADVDGYVAFLVTFRHQAMGP